MTGEWLFAPTAFGLGTPDDGESYFQAFPEELELARKIGKDKVFLLDLRRSVLPLFIEKCFSSVPWSRYQVVGFSSTFQQNVASRALARRIKERHPEVTVVFGGANMEGEMGLEFARAFSFIDYVVSGEGDVVFPALLSGLATDKIPEKLPGLIAKGPDGLTHCQQAAPIRDLDALPVPKYDSYFDRAIQLGMSPHYQAIWTLPFESSRGCWWGEKHHCTFCGLNGLGMTYRSKSAPRVLKELSELARKYQITAFSAVDNILDWKYIPRFSPSLNRVRMIIYSSMS